MDKFKTKDIFEASFIYSQDVDLANLELDSNYYWFVFMQKENAEKLSSLYWSGKAEGFSFFKEKRLSCEGAEHYG